MLVLLFALIARMETEIGNEVRISIRKAGSSLEFRAYWPDGFIMSSRYDVAEIEDIVTDEIIVDGYIRAAKEAHPSLAPFIS